MIPYKEARKQFHTLLRWHLDNGTRPPAHHRRGLRWTGSGFAKAIREAFKITCDESAVRHWTNGRHLPGTKLDYIEFVLFGDEPSDQYATWRSDFRAAYVAAARDAPLPRQDHSEHRPSGFMADADRLRVAAHSTDRVSAPLPSEYQALRELAEQENPEAQYNLGLLHIDGLGVALDTKMAMKWITKAAAQGYLPAQVKAGYLYWVGEGIRNDTKRALHWLRKAAGQGDSSGQYYLAEFYASEYQYDEARKWYIRAATQGHREAINEIAWEYSTGLRGAGRDYVEALRWYRVAAEQGDPLAQRSLAWMYEEGRGVPQDYGEALRWYRLSANSGDTVAEFHIGTFYRDGLGVERDYSTALSWFYRAANGDQIEAEVALGVMYRDGLGVMRDYKIAERHFERAAYKGNAEAQECLGAMYANGWGVPKDMKKAHLWMQKAAEGNSEEAKRWLAENK